MWPLVEAPEPPQASLPLGELLRLATAGPVTCEWVHDFSRLEQLVPEWDALWRKADLSVFQNFAWVRAFWRAYGPDLNVCSLVARRSDAVVAILPLALQRRTLRFLGSPESDYTNILFFRPDACWASPSLLSALLDLPLPWKSCVFENLPSDARLLQGMRNLPHALQRHLQ